MLDDILPEREPGGALVPPPRHPSTALAAASALPPHRPSASVASRPRTFGEVVHATLDTLDEMGDTIAAAIGLR